MKSNFLFCTRLRFYWVELPLILLMTLAIHYNKHSTALLKLYPLLVFCGAAMIFVIVFFFRLIQISYDEIKYVGLFSSRDKALINEGKTLIFRIEKRNKLQVTLFGNDGVTAELDWLKNSGEAPRDTDLFRGKAIGGRRAVKQVLYAFGVETEAVEKLLYTDEECGFDFELASPFAYTEDGARIVKIRINKTI